jgi:predicted RNA-binding Zn ribbon-like protein
VVTDFHWLGGRPALDLVNTVGERWRGRVERLRTPGDLALWLARAGLLERERRVTRAVLDEARALREAIDAAVQAEVAGEPAPAAAVAHIDEWLVHAGPRPHLAVGPDGRPALGEREAADSPRRARGMIALDAATMLGSPEQARRVRICASDTCAARFYDRSPAGRRKWCTMDRCGNAAKARRHRAKAKG